MTDPRDVMRRELDAGFVRAETARSVTRLAYQEAMAPAVKDFVKTYSLNGRLNRAFFERISKAARRGKTETQFQIGPIPWDFMANGFDSGLLTACVESSIGSVRDLMTKSGYHAEFRHHADKSNDRIDVLLIVSWRSGEE